MTFNASRRHFIKTGASAIALSAFSTGLLQAAGGQVPLAIDESSLGSAAKGDLAGSLAAMSRIGYKAVSVTTKAQFRKAVVIKKLLDDNGLACCCYKEILSALQPKADAFKVALNYCQELGTKFAILNGGAPGKTKAEWLQKAELYNEVAGLFAKAGVSLGYAPDSSIFGKIEGEFAWDIFFGKTKPEITAHINTTSVMGGGQAVAEIVRKNPGRCKTVELDEYAPKDGIIGTGQVPWKDVFQACESVGGTAWYIVRLRYTRNDPLPDAQRTFDALKAMGKV